MALTLPHREKCAFLPEMVRPYHHLRLGCAAFTLKPIPIIPENASHRRHGESAHFFPKPFRKLTTGGLHPCIHSETDSHNFRKSSPNAPLSGRVEPSVPIF